MPLVLVVDDTPVVRVLARSALEDAGLEVEDVAGGEQALERLRQEPTPDAVVLDIMMPGVSGHHVLRVIGEDGDDIPVVMLTCKTDDVDIQAAFNAGARDYVTKPFDPDDLVHAVRSAIYG